MKLELKHFSPYLPYGLRIKTKSKDGDVIKIVDGIYKQYEDGSFILYWQENFGSLQDSSAIKPILRPLSDINREEMEIIREIGLFITKKEQWKNSHWSFIREVKSFPTLQKYSVISKLFEWHFDVFGLINKGLAIDINTLSE